MLTRAGLLAKLRVMLANLTSMGTAVVINDDNGLPRHSHALEREISPKSSCKGVPVMNFALYDAQAWMIVLEGRALSFYSSVCTRLECSVQARDAARSFCLVSMLKPLCCVCCVLFSLTHRAKSPYTVGCCLGGSRSLASSGRRAAAAPFFISFGQKLDHLYYCTLTTCQWALWRSWLGARLSVVLGGFESL